MWKIVVGIVVVLFAFFIWCLLRAGANADRRMFEPDGERRRAEDRKKMRDSRRAS